MIMDLEGKLRTLGLSQYATILYENGFEDWDTVLDITEEDLASLGIKRGHRRVLQKEIASVRGYQSTPPIDSPQQPSTPGSQVGLSAEALDKRTKRRYRWHPRPDPNAPKKPKTAYVNFADHLRSDPTIASLSFVNIAREVGRRWQAMEPPLKQDWENRAAVAMQNYEDNMDMYRSTKQYQEYQDYLETFRKAPGKSARQKIKSRSTSSLTSPRRSESSGPERSPSASVIESPDLVSPEEAARSSCRAAIDAAFRDLSRIRATIGPDAPITLASFPSATVCRPTIATIYEGGSDIAYLISKDDAENLINRIYVSPMTADVLSMTEFCLLAAVGGCLAPKLMPTQDQQYLFGAACSLLTTLPVVEAMYLRLMRIFLWVSVRLIMEKHSGAQAFVAAGLAIAKLRHPFTSEEQPDEWKRLHRTLVLTECWLSQALGYTARDPDFHFRHVVEPIPLDHTTGDAIQLHAVRIAIVGNEILSFVRRQGPMPTEIVRYLASQLEYWQRELPPNLQLSSCLSSAEPPIGRENVRTMLAVHIFYLGSIILLFGQPLIAAEEVGLNPKEPEVLQCRSTCLAAGEQLTQVMISLHGFQTWSPKTWPLIYWAFSACNVLLLGAAQALRQRSTNEYDRLVSHCEKCLTALETCSAEETIAARYLDIIQPIYARLRHLRESPHIDLKRRKSEHKISINDLLASSDGQPRRWNTIDDELPGLINQISALLRDPFGKNQAQNAAEEPYPSPPSNADLLCWFRT